MTGRNAPETDATRGSAALALAQRATSVVDTRTRRGDPFADKSSVVITLSEMRSRDPNTTPRDAIALAQRNEEVVALPSPTTGRACLTVLDRRRIAACHARYRDAGDERNAAVCERLLRDGELPERLNREYVTDA